MQDFIRDFIKSYPRDIDNYQLKLAESHYLIKAFAENSITDLQQFAVLRRVRVRLIGEIFADEMMIETIEGFNEYTRIIAINQNNRAEFVNEVEKHINILRRPDGLLDIGANIRSSGCMLCLALKSIGIDFDGNKNQPIFNTINFEKTPIEILF